MENEIAEDEIRERAPTDGKFAIAYALLRVAGELNKLGFADAHTPMGAIEALAMMTKEGLVSVADAIDRTTSS